MFITEKTLEHCDITEPVRENDLHPLIISPLYKDICMIENTTKHDGKQIESVELSSNSNSGNNLDRNQIEIAINIRFAICTELTIENINTRKVCVQLKLGMLKHVRINTLI